jgi:hypothetical protein
VKPREAFVRYFQAAADLARRREEKRGVEARCQERERRDSNPRFTPHDIETR